MGVRVRLGNNGRAVVHGNDLSTRAFFSDL
jgi:hypothetical protein